MFVRRFAEGEPFHCAGSEYVMLVPRDVTNCCEVVLESIAPGRETPPNAHATFHQVFIVLKGEADITIGNERRQVRAPAVAYIPARTDHSVRNAGATELQYVYASVWSTGIPIEEMLGGWKRACANMVQEYAERGFPPKPDDR